MPGEHAIVTLDVLHSGVIWGWFVTMNLWAKSLSTGAVLVGAWAMARHPGSSDFYRRWMPILAFVFLNVTLFFTTFDLHQPQRFWHLFVYFNPTSAVAWAGWILALFNALLVVVLFFTWRDDRVWLDRLKVPLVGLAFAATLYTAALLGQANAREVWSTPTEVAQTLLSAGLAGSAVYLLFPRLDLEERRSLGLVLAGTSLVSLLIFLAELVFAPMKSEEARATVELLVSGELAPLMVPGLLLGFAVPLVVALGARGSSAPLRIAALSALVGLWMVKHAFLVAPQLLPLS
jgi:hypothetical protein